MSSARRLAAFAMALAAWAAAPGAQAQSATFLDAPSPEGVAVSAGGVDVRTGRHTYSATDVSAGEGAGAISFERTMPTPMQGHVTPLGNFSHNWDIVLVIKAVPIDQYPGNYDYVANVSYGGRSQTFEKLYLGSSVFEQKSKNAFTRLTTPGTIGANNIVYTFRATDGTVAVFRQINTGQCASSSYGYQCANVDYIVEPDGTRYDFEYDTTTGQTNNVRLRAVISNRGYALLLEYGAGGATWSHVSKACVLNLAQTAKPANNNCPGGALATASYTYTTIDGRKVLASAVTPDSATDSYTYTTVSAGVSYTMGYKKAGQASPWMTNSFEYSTTSEGEDEPIVKAQAFADGSGFTYYYDKTPDTSDGSGQSTSYQTVAGGAYVNALGAMTQVRYNFPPMPQSFNPPRVVGAPGGYQYVYLGDRVFQATPGPVSIIDPLGRETKSDYCDANATASLPPQENNRCLVAQLQSTTDPEGNSVEIAYGINDNVIELRRVAKPGSGLADSVASATYSTSACTSYLVTCNKPLTVTDPKGVVTDYTWDSTHGGVLTETLAEPTAGATRPQKRYTYGQFYAWYKNAAGALVQSAYPVWLVTQISECSTGTAPGCIGTANETRTTFTYGAPGIANNLLPTARTIATGNGSLSATVSWTYDDFGNKLTEDGPLAGTGDTTRWRYDVRRRVVGVVMPDPDGGGSLPHPATRNTYDAAGRLVKVESGHVAGYGDTDWAGFTVVTTAETQYDALDRKTAEWSYGTTGGTQQLTQYSYDLAGRLECTAVRMNPAIYASLPASACTLGTEGSNGPDRITRTVYDAAGQVVQVRKAVGTSLEIADVTYSYTPNGKIEHVVDANGNRAKLEYDGFDRQVKWIFPSTTRPASFNPATAATALSTAGSLNTADYEQYGYDANGNRTSLRKRDGSVLAYQYDALNRMTRKTVPERAGLAATHTQDVFYDYDLRGLQLKARFGSLTGLGLSYAYDGFGRLVSESQDSDGTLRTVASQYDLNGNRTRVTHPGGQYFQLTYDGLGRATSLKQTNLTLGTIGYNDRGLPTQLAWSYGASSANTRSFTYDPAGRLASIGFDLHGTVGDATWSFTRNPAGQILTETQSNDLYSWDGHVNLTRAYTTNGLNQYVSAGPASFCYDPNGNLTADGSSVFLYDVENRLVERRVQGVGNTNCAALSYGGALLAELRYDPLGRLYNAKGYVSGVLQSDIRFAYDGNAMIAEYNGSGTMLRRYVHGSNTESDDPLIWYEGSTVTNATRRYLHADPRGSILSVTDYQGLPIATNSYDEFGIPSLSNSGRFQYTGQMWLAEVGCYHYKARIYCPTIGRFLQTDPIGYEDQFNLYAYVANDPINAVDPTGLEEKNLSEEDRQGVLRDFLDGVNEVNKEVGHQILDKVGQVAWWVTGLAIDGATVVADYAVPDALSDVGHPKWSGDVMPSGQRARPEEVAFAKYLGGDAADASVKFANQPNPDVEFDVITDKVIGQITNKTGFSSEFSRQIGRTFDAASDTGRDVHFRFTGGRPDRRVMRKIGRESARHRVRTVFSFGKL